MPISFDASVAQFVGIANASRRNPRPDEETPPQNDLGLADSAWEKMDKLQRMDGSLDDCDGEKGRVTARYRDSNALEQPLPAAPRKPPENAWDKLQRAFEETPRVGVTVEHESVFTGNSQFGEIAECKKIDGVPMYLARTSFMGDAVLQCSLEFGQQDGNGIAHFTVTRSTPKTHQTQTDTISWFSEPHNAASAPIDLKGMLNIP